MAASVVVALLPVTAAHADPTVEITSPGAGVVAGTVPVSVTALGDLGATATSVRLQVDGVDVNASDTQCPTTTDDPPPCTVTIQWDSSAYLGAHTLTAVFFQTGAAVTQVVSSGVAVTVEKVPVVSIDSPTVPTAPAPAFVPVNSAIDVAVSGSTDPSDSDPTTQIAVTATPQGGSPADVGQVTCGAATCSGQVHFDPTGLDGAVTLRATVTTQNGLTSSTTLAVVVERPTVAITAPADTSTVSGQVQVTASAVSAQATLDQLTSVDLLVDGTKVDSLQCAAPGAGTCDLVLAWDATAVPSGQHTLTARLTTQAGLVILSPDVHVHVIPPPATVAISTPATKAVVSGLTRVSITTATNPRALDHPRRVDLFVDGGPVFGRPCPTAASTCTVNLGWSTTKLAGQHRITARVTTASGGTVFSARVYVWVRTGSVTRVSRMAVVPSGRGVTFRGRVVSTTTGHGLGGAPVRLLVVRGNRSYVVRVTTRSDGSFALSLRVFTATRVLTRASAPWLGMSTAAILQAVRAPIRCHLSSTSVRSGSTGTGLCTVSALPRGTPVALYYTTRGRTTLLAKGAARGAQIPFTYRFIVRGFYTLRVVIGSNANYIASRGQPLGVTVR